MTIEEIREAINNAKQIKEPEEMLSITMSDLIVLENFIAGLQELCVLKEKRIDRLEAELRMYRFENQRLDDYTNLDIKV